MHKIYLIFLYLMLWVGSTAFGQQFSCGTEYVMNQLLQNSAEARAQKISSDAAWVEFSSRPIDPEHLVVYENNDTIYEIPIVFHVMHSGEPVGHTNNPSDASIIAYLNYLNKSLDATFSFYATPQNGGVKVPIRFVMAKRTPGCNPVATNGINRINVAATYANYASYGVALQNNQGVSDVNLKNLSRWDRSQYYNVWLVNYIDGPNNSAGGYAYLPPGSPGENDGTVVLVEYTTPYQNGNYYKALPHEVGHSFGLHHTFHGSSAANQCPSNANCNSDNDMVCDTEVHSLNQVCPAANAINNCTSLPFNNVQYNIMNYTNCMTSLRFTQGQRQRMLYHLFTYRSSLVHSLGGTPIATQAPTNLVAASCSPSVNVTDNRLLQGGPTFVKLGNFEYATFNYNSDNIAYVDYSCIMDPPQFEVGSSYPLQVGSYPFNTNFVRVYIDYNNNGIFETAERVASGSAATSNNFLYTTSITIPANAVTCTPIRMRVRADVGSSTFDPCVTLNNGQVEDYAIILNPASVTAPTATISSSVGNSTCVNQSVVFSSNITNLPANGVLRWYKNNILVGTGTSYTTSNIANNDNFRLIVSYPTTCSRNDSITSNIITMSIVNNALPTINITNSQSNTVCQGQAITFTANVTNQGSTPTFQWKVNGVNAGTNSATFAPNNLTNNAVVTCVLTSSLTCISSNNITSNAITVTVSPNVTPSVAISTSNNNLCINASLTFTATPTNGGSAPTYQWRVNGVNVTGTGATYTSNTLNNNDVVSVVMTSNASCRSQATATSNNITVISTANGTPLVSIASNATNNTVCQGSNITFTATPTMGGTAPVYQWRVNGVNAGTNSPTFTTNTLTNGAQVTVVMTSNAPCLGTQVATSNAISVVVTTPAVPAVSIIASQTNLCLASTITFTASPTNGGTNPTYQWRVNGANVAGSGATFTTATLQPNDAVSVVMTTSIACYSSQISSSNVITVNRVGITPPSVSIANNVTNNTICRGATVVFTATPVNGGTNPVYQWKLNGNNVGNNSATYTTATLNNNDVVSCTIVSNAQCISTAPVSSNVITMTVNPLLTSTIQIAASQNNICEGTSVTFTATTTNGGLNPLYRWTVNGVNAGTNANTFTTTTLSNNDIVACELTIVDLCVMNSIVNSNVIGMQVVTNVTPTIAITATNGTTICSYDSVFVTSIYTNGGANPTYVWKLNGVTLGQTGSTIALGGLANNDELIAELTSTERCVTSATATSNALVFDVTTSGPITLDPTDVNMVCEFGILPLTLTNVNGSINWYLNDTLLPNQFTSTIMANYEGTYFAINELNGCISRSNTATIILDPMPAPALQLINGAFEVDSTYDAYTWYFNDAYIASNPTFRHIPHAYGYFKVCVKREHCNACTEAIYYPDPLSAGKLDKQLAKVYPNPTIGVIHVDYFEKLNIEIRTVDGRILKSEQNTLSIDISELIDGAYMIYLIDKDDRVLQVNKMFKNQ